MTPPISPLNNLVKRLNWVLSKRKGIALALTGPTGVGKSWTAQQILAQVPCPHRTVSAGVSMLGVLEALPRPEKLPPWVESGLERLRRGQSTAGAEVLTAYLVQLAPFVLHLEDLHEADPERLQFWQALAEGVGRSRGVAILAASRGNVPQAFEEYPVMPLEPAQITALLQVEAGGVLPPEATHWIWQHAQGNPLFSLEYFRHLSRQGNLWSDGHRWRWRTPESELMPTSVEAIIAQQLQRIAPSSPARAALALWAVLPLGLEAQPIAQIAEVELEQLQALEQRLQTEDIVKEGRFAHPLFAEVAAGLVPEWEREQIVLRGLKLLPEPLAAAALVQWGGQGLPEAGAALRAALELTRSMGDHAQATSLLRQLAALAPMPEQLRLILEAAQEMRQVNIGQALEIAEEARRLDRHNLDAALMVAELLAWVGRGAEAERLLAGLPGSERVLLSQVLVKHLNHDYPGVLELWRTHPKLPIEPALIARAFVQLRQLEEARTFIAKALKRSDLGNFDRAQLLYIQAFVPHFAADYKTAEAEFSQFLQTLRSLDDGSARYHDLWGGTHQLRAYARSAQGRPREAIADSQVALQFAAQQGNGGVYAFRRSEQALYLLECGEYLQAEEVLHESRSVLERLGNRIYLARAEAIAARLYLDWGVPHGPALALRHARMGLEYARQSGEVRPPAVVPVWLIGAWVEAVHGRPEVALSLVNELKQLAQQTRQGAFAPAARWAEGLALERMGQAKEAQELLGQAITQALPMPFGPHPERMALELDRLKVDRSSIRRRLEQLRKLGLGGTIQVAERYFPWLVHSEAEPIQEQKTRLEVLGPMTVGGAPLSERTRKGKELLALLLEARLLGRGGVGGLELIDQIYPELDEDKALAALKQLVYRLRSVLGTGAVLRTGDGYALGALSSDAEEFLGNGDLELWRGMYLEDLDQGLGGTVREVLYHSLQSRATEQLSTNPEGTLRVAQIMLQADPYDETALALALHSHQSLGNPKAMHELYRQAKARLAEVGERLPESVEVFLQRNKGKLEA